MNSIPSSTYRIQLNSSFNFRQLNSIIDYLYDLGISTIYSSPFFKALPGSSHGYDVTDAHSINPEIGSMDEFRALSKKIKEKGMSWVQDIVPNHMAFSASNKWLSDVLERGKDSEFYYHFDILPKHYEKKYSGKLMAPFLGNTLEDAIANKEIQLAFDPRKGFAINTPGDAYPLSTCSYKILTEIFISITLDISEFEKIFIATNKSATYEQWQMDKQDQLKGQGALNEKIVELVNKINGDTNLLKRLLDNQSYILTCWKETNHTINYRRFFTINVLICLAMENEKTFEDYHKFIHSLYEEGLINGLRIDHIDGLKNPGEYINRIRKTFGNDCYLIIEKILSGREILPTHWNIHGTSGYEFLSFVNQLLTDKGGGEQLRDFYHSILPSCSSYHDQIYQYKTYILQNYMRGELDNLVYQFFEAGLNNKTTDKKKFSDGLEVFMCCLPVYRIYPEKYPLDKEDSNIIDETYETAKHRAAHLSMELEMIYSLFKEENSSSDKKEDRLQFIQRLMQFTGPLTAKGVEDTTFYNYNALISHNEVGDSPSMLGDTVENFHNKMLYRNEHLPHSLNATSTHDTKRGEDSRIRINVISEFVSEWKELVTEWQKINESLKTRIGKKHAPSINDEYFIYQALLGAFPQELRCTDIFCGRIKDYLTKAIREAKTNTNWDQPDQEYENACHHFLDEILSEKQSFLKTFIPFLEKILPYSAIYSLSQALIRITAPGIPDTYQGSELFDLSFVDPDNRSPVDYDKRKAMLDELISLEKKGSKDLFNVLKQRRNEGLEKLYLIKKVLNFRRQFPDIFSKGEYIPVYAEGNKLAVVCWCRKHDSKWILVLCPLQLVKRVDPKTFNLENAFKDIRLTLPTDAPTNWRNELTGENFLVEELRDPGRLLKSFPVALLFSVHPH